MSESVKGNPIEIQKSIEITTQKGTVTDFEIEGFGKCEIITAVFESGKYHLFIATSEGVLKHVVLKDHWIKS